jgi:F420-dependent oxidoreductase-like protein
MTTRAARYGDRLLSCEKEVAVLDVPIIIEGQDGINWARWRRLVRAVEDLGFARLYRSGHFTNPTGPNRDALGLWSSLTWLAEHTNRIEFGPLVSPVSFRHPIITAWAAAAVDDLAGGRLRLGLGAGWQERVHRTYGFNLLDTGRRFARFEEGLEVIIRLLQDEGPVSLDGEFYRLHDAVLMPSSTITSGTPIVIGGNGPNRTLPLVARYAGAWNVVFVPAKRFVELSTYLNELLRAVGRSPERVRRTLMTRVIFGRTTTEVERKLGGERESDSAPTALSSGRHLRSSSSSARWQRLACNG